MDVNKEIISGKWCIPSEFDGQEIFRKIAAFLSHSSALPLLRALKLSETPEELEHRQCCFEQMYSFISEQKLSIGARTDVAVLAEIRQDKPFLEREELAILGLDCLDFLEFQQLVRERFPFLVAGLSAGETDILHELVLRFGATFAPDLQIKDTASSRLRELRSEMHKLRERLIKQARHFLHSAELSAVLQEDFYVELNGRVVLLIKTDFKGKLSGIAHGISHSGNTTYYEPQELVTSNNLLQDVIEGEGQEIRRILAELNAIVHRNRNSIISVLNFLQEMDVLRAKVLFCQDFPSSRPLISRDGAFVVRNFFHPLVKNCVKNSMDLDAGSRIMVLSGPNSGGKTVTLKSLALCNYFASLGMYVPAEECLLPFFKRILFILGDNQSIVDSLSTFAAHLKNWRRILNRANDSTVLFVDEIMDATDPREGEVLACEILRYLGRSGCRAFISTHYNEVKRLALESSVFVNASMKFNESCLEPEFILCSGIPGRSYGIELAEKFNLPRSVTGKARKNLGRAHFELNSLIEKQKSELLSMQDLRQKEEALLRQLEKLRNHLEELQEDFTRQREGYLEKAYKRVLREHESFRHRWEALYAKKALVKESVVKESVVKGDTTKEMAVKEIAAKELGAKEANRAEIDYDESLFQSAWLDNQRKYAARLARHKKTDILRPGDLVMVLPYNKQARVLEIMAGRNELKVEMGAVTLILSDKEVEKSAGLSESPRKATRGGVRIVSSQLSTEVDLRGFDRDEALYELENHLDGAVSKGSPRILIICGKGVLRNAILEFLRRSPLTANRDFSFPNDGSMLVDLG